MKAEEAIAGFQELSRKFREGYKWGELEPIWPELLQCSHQAMVRTVGILIKNGQRKPSPKYVLAQVQWQHMNLTPLVCHEEEVAKGRDPDGEAREALALMKSLTLRDENPEEFTRRLFELSNRHCKPSYAMVADEFKRKVS
jgi:hypothetical protein